MHGHTHSGNGIVTIDNITFSNAAMKIIPKPHVFDYYLDSKTVVTIS